jgi:hypothetical protein
MIPRLGAIGRRPLGCDASFAGRLHRLQNRTTNDGRKHLASLPETIDVRPTLTNRPTTLVIVLDATYCTRRRYYTSRGVYFRSVNWLTSM